MALTAASGLFTSSTSRPAQCYTQASIHNIPMTKKKVLNSERALPLVLTSAGVFQTVKKKCSSLSECQESCDCPLRTQKSAETLISLNKLTSALLRLCDTKERSQNITNQHIHSAQSQRAKTSVLPKRVERILLKIRTDLASKQVRGN